MLINKPVVEMREHIKTLTTKLALVPVMKKQGVKQLLARLKKFLSDLNTLTAFVRQEYCFFFRPYCHKDY